MRLSSRPLLTVAVLGALSLTAAACGSDDKKSSSSSSAAAAPGASTITAAESEWKIVPSAPSVKAGKVTFDAKNVGKTEHELVVIKTDKPADGLGTGKEASETGSVGEAEGIEAGQSKKVTLDLKPGKYVLICNEPGHYKLGMHTAFTVQ